ncbi:hypothetical protein MML48_1g12767 [Holotrichia oblita]|uniref:Uncharacterized protein n=1 Tax=Holotrichia oblita TaxID=644536 RepID=A0ACB9TYW5_HOLOL|nr:hypothetical protein MML48_1g12767 [Holotrichia oblita]
MEPYSGPVLLERTLRDWRPNKIRHLEQLPTPGGRQTGLTVQEALTMIEDDEDFCRKTEEIILYPPVNACDDQTDEDSGDEFGLSLNNLRGSQLDAAFEVKFHSDDEWSSDDDVPLSIFIKSAKHIRNNNAKDKKKYNWENIDLTPETSTFENETIVGNRMTSIDLFSLFFDHSLLQLILDKTQYYAQTKNRTQLVEMSVLILSGRRMFCEREKDAQQVRIYFIELS